MQASKQADTPNWKVHRDSDNLLWLNCDRAGESTNVLSEAVLSELNDILLAVEQDLPAGLIVGSAKPGSFVLGADIKAFDSFTSADAVSEKIREGHAVLARLENLSCPTVAIIEGYCLGGGLELALACNYRIARNIESTRIGLPEVKLGIFPGLGGTVRLTERTGAVAAMDLMLTGRMLRAGAARKLGVIDELVDEFGNLDWAARRAIRKKRKPGKLTLAQRTSHSRPARHALARVLQRKTAEKARPEHYPAPFALIELWRDHRDNRRRMFEEEARRVGELMVGDTAKNLRRVYFMTERMKGLGKTVDQPLKRVHVVGGGVMGGDIAAWCVTQGMDVTLQDRDMQYIEPAIKRATQLFNKRLKTKARVNAALARLRPDLDGSGAADADVVIEAIFEDAEAKRALYASIEPKLQPHAILATNTSALPLKELSRELSDPSRLIGLHFFNPVAKMPLVEVIHDTGSDQRHIDAGCAFCSKINRFPLPTQSSPGFLVNRVLAPYLMEAITLLLEGVDKDTIDAAAVRFGMPVGPIELADQVGLDVCMKVAETLIDGNVEGQRALLAEKIEAGKLGKKSGEGFYEWKKGQVRHKKVNVDNAYGDELAQRLIEPFLAECVAASNEGIVADDELLDAGIIFGTGFAPFTGGPLRYLEQQGIDRQALLERVRARRAAA